MTSYPNFYPPSTLSLLPLVLKFLSGMDEGEGQPFHLAQPKFPQ